MSSDAFPSIFRLYQRILSGRRAEALAQQQGWKVKARIYSLGLLFWMMIFQRLQAPGTLLQAVQSLRQEKWEPLRPRPSRRRRRRAVSARTGGYCRARQRVPTGMVRMLTDYLTTQLQKCLAEPSPQPRPAYVLDGSSLQMQPEAELQQSYPPARNQHGRAHWPVMRIVVLHDARTGLALPPAWAPMFGPQALSEQALAPPLMEQTPREAVLLGDRNFGIFFIAFAASKRQRAVILRLTKSRAECLGGRDLRPGTEPKVVWRPSPWDRRQHPELPEDAQVSGRLLVRAARGWREPIYLFTTLEEPAEQVLELYGLRWNIETDLRSLKRTVRLHRLASKSRDMIEKELWVALAAYNLVRAVILLAARQANLDPRQLSFSAVLYLVNGFLPDLLTCSPHKARREIQRLIDLAASCTLPKRRHKRSYPRAVWRPGYRYPARREHNVASK